MNELEQDHVQRVRAAMSSGSTYRAASKARATAEILAALEVAPSGTDAFKVARELPNMATREMGRIAAWNLFQDGRLVMTEQHDYVLADSPEV